MLSLMEVMIDSLLTIKTTKDLENDMVSLFKELLTACVIFIALPVTVASAESSFSKLKIIKNYLRNPMEQERLSNISILSIERSKTHELNINKIINDFALKRQEKKIFVSNFVYKFPVYH